MEKGKTMTAKFYWEFAAIQCDPNLPKPKAVHIKQFEGDEAMAAFQYFIEWKPTILGVAHFVTLSLYEKDLNHPSDPPTMLSKINAIVWGDGRKSY